ncbi:hypothetical protein [Pseudomonas sp. GM_Psu_2]|uniref:hypothetical protein n=1 Tax=unclassified Pseudomonas TaxID=196821 RepID=UPI002269E372|nr:hypothetical protein [Pseudomonas sp. GM_Psu_2]
MTFSACYDRICLTIGVVFAVLQYYAPPVSPAPVSPPAIVVVIQASQVIQSSEAPHLIIRRR